MDFNQKSKILVSTSLKLVPYLEQEIRNADYIMEDSSVNAVTLNGSVNDAILLCSKLRIATSVRWLVKSFKAIDQKELYNEIKLIRWEDYFDISKSFSVTSAVEHPGIKNSMYANLICKDAIVDRFNHKFGKRPDSGSDRKEVVVFLYWKNNEAELYLDISGDSLSKHGYRINPYKAPLAENLAAAIIVASRWDRKSHFINPMCGSGTLAIEAALIAQKLPLTSTRNNFGFMHLKGFDAAAQNGWNEHNKTSETKKADFKIIASDHDRRALEAAKENAKKANVDSLIDFQLADFTETLIPDGDGVVMLNPPYGERMENSLMLERIYSGIGDFFKKYCQGKRGFVFTGNMELAKKIGLKAKRRMEFFNAKIDCRLLEYELYSGSKRIQKPS